jgi:hypothetical protein
MFFFDQICNNRSNYNRMSGMISSWVYYPGRMINYLLQGFFIQHLQGCSAPAADLLLLMLNPFGIP